jgi:hypothetical protein
VTFDALWRLEWAAHNGLEEALEKARRAEIAHRRGEEA